MIETYGIHTKTYIKKHLQLSLPCLFKLSIGLENLAEHALGQLGNLKITNVFESEFQLLSNLVELAEAFGPIPLQIIVPYNLELMNGAHFLSEWIFFFRNGNDVNSTWLLFAIPLTYLYSNNSGIYSK